MAEEDGDGAVVAVAGGPVEGREAELVPEVDPEAEVRPEALGAGRGLEGGGKAIDTLPPSVL